VALIKHQTALSQVQILSGKIHNKSHQNSTLQFQNSFEKSSYLATKVCIPLHILPQNSISIVKQVCRPYQHTRKKYF